MIDPNNFHDPLLTREERHGLFNTVIYYSQRWDQAKRAPKRLFSQRSRKANSYQFSGRFIYNCHSEKMSKPSVLGFQSFMVDLTPK